MVSEAEKKQAQDDGYILCTECGHIIDGDHQGISGCVHCDCPNYFSDDDIVALMKDYEMVPYKLGARVTWHGGTLTDAGTVVVISTQDESVDVKWDLDGEVTMVKGPRYRLVAV